MFVKLLAQTGGSGHLFISSFSGEEWGSQSRGCLSHSTPVTGEETPRKPSEASEPLRREVIRKGTQGEIAKQTC